MDIIVTSSPKRIHGHLGGRSALLFFIGMVIGPALAGVLMQGNHIPNEDAGGSLVGFLSCTTVIQYDILCNRSIGGSIAGVLRNAD
jgi:hypothetical protein